MVRHKQEMQTLFRESPKATIVIFFFAARTENNQSKVEKAPQRGGPSAKRAVMGWKHAML
jgi:hypothetical protein